MKSSMFKNSLIFSIVGILLILSITPALSSGDNIDSKDSQDIESSNKSDFSDSNVFSQSNIENEEMMDHFFEHGNSKDKFRRLINMFNTPTEYGTRDLFTNKEFVTKNSVLCGYVNDSQTGLPIEKAEIFVSGRDDQGNYYSNNTSTDPSGFYYMNVAAGIISLYPFAARYYIEFSGHNISENEKLWVNLSLTSISAENATVCGYVTDAETNEAIEDVAVELIGTTNYYGYYYNLTFTDSSGFYCMNVLSGYISLYEIYAEGYFKESSYYFKINESETLWLNMSLTPIPPENSVVCGYVRDATNNEPLEGVNVSLSWRDNQGHQYTNFSYTDHNGFYCMNVAAGRIWLYFYGNGYFEESDYRWISEDETVWISMYLYPRPPENSVIYGYVKDNQTEDPLENATIRLYWQDNMGHNESNYTSTDLGGFYSLNTAYGKIRLRVSKYGYYTTYTKYYDIGENETLGINVSLSVPLPENSVVCGFIIDADNFEPIAYADVELYWRDNHGHYYWNYTYTDSNGSYRIHVAAGVIKLYCWASGYYSNSTGYYYVGQNETLWINVSLRSRTHIEAFILKPSKGLYIRNRKILSFIRPLIIGNIDIEVGVNASGSGVDSVEFYVDGKLREIDYYPPYSYTWKGCRSTIFRHRHTIKIIAFNNVGKSTTDEITVWRFL